MSKRRSLPPVATTAIYSADVILQDAETGETLNPKLHFPDGSVPLDLQVNDGPRKSVYSDTIGSISAELDRFGRCRLIWIGLPRLEYAFRLSADGYDPIPIPFEFVDEVYGARTIFGIREPDIVKIRKSSR